MHISLYCITSSESRGGTDGPRFPVASVFAVFECEKVRHLTHKIVLNSTRCAKHAGNTLESHLHCQKVMKRYTARYSLAAVVLLFAAGAIENRTGGQKHKDTGEDFIFEVQPREIAAGEGAVLRWSIKGATQITIEEEPESMVGRGELQKLGTFEGGSGTLQVKPAENTTYVISCTGETKYTCASLSVRVRVKR